jgi:outer membrane protein assembly factor BamB
MSIRKLIRNFRNWCPQPPTPLPTKIKRYSMPIAAIVTATIIFSISFSIFSLSLVSHSSVPIIPLAIAPSSTTSTPLWNYTTGSLVSSRPTYADGMLYVTAFEHNEVYALNATDGAKLWSTFSGFTNIASSPAVANGVVYINSLSGNFEALNASNGNQIWTYPIGGKSSAAIVDGVVYVGSDFLDNSTYEGAVYALNATDGAKLWSYITGGSVDSSPAVVNGVVYISSWEDHIGNNIYAFKADSGAKLWNYTTGYGDFATSSSPAVVDGIVYVGSTDHNVYALTAENGKKIWNYTTGSWVGSSPAVAYGVVYVGSNDHKVYALNAANGEEFWNYTTGDAINSSPAVAYGVVYVGSSDGNFYALNAADGSILWYYFTGNPFESPTITSSAVYVGSGANVYAFNLSIASSSPNAPSASPTSPSLFSNLLPIIIGLLVAITVVSIIAVVMLKKKPKKAGTDK